MGADLFIESLHNKCYAEWKPQFDEAVKARDLAKGNDKLVEELRAKIDEAYNGMYADGYFRDSYNTSSVLWQMNLSWWGDVIPMLDENDLLSVEKCKTLRLMILGTPILIADGWTPEWGESREECLAYFQDKRERLIAFLDQAISLNEPIRCSL